MGRGRKPFGCSRSYKYRLLYTKGIKLIPPSNNELIHLYTKNLIFHLRSDIMQFMKHTATLSK